MTQQTNKYASLDLGTIEAVFNKLGGLEGAKRFLSGAAEVVPKSILSAYDNVVSDAIETFDPHAFYKACDGLWIGEAFRDNILAKATPVKKLSTMVLKSFELTKNANDREIIECLPQNYELDISEALARIAQMIEKQPGGKEGDLLNNGYVNLFYVPGFVVSVNWHADFCGWSVHAYELVDNNSWRAGRRVFVRN